MVEKDYFPLGELALFSCRPAAHMQLKQLIEELNQLGPVVGKNQHIFKVG